jgi:hypothetical protein
MRIKKLWNELVRFFRRVRVAMTPIGGSPEGSIR